MKGHSYFGIHLSWVALEGSEQWTVTIDQDGMPMAMRPARFLCNGPVDLYTLHDILKVLDNRVESALIRVVGLQTSMADVVGIEPGNPHVA